MPTYKNQNAQESLLVIEGESFPYGKNVETDHYIDHPDLVFVSHTPKKDRVKKLHIGAIPVEAGVSITESLKSFIDAQALVWK